MYNLSTNTVTMVYEIDPVDVCTVIISLISLVLSITAFIKVCIMEAARFRIEIEKYSVHFDNVGNKSLIVVYKVHNNNAHYNTVASIDICLNNCRYKPSEHLIERFSSYEYKTITVVYPNVNSTEFTTGQKLNIIMDTTRKVIKKKALLTNLQYMKINEF